MTYTSHSRSNRPLGLIALFSFGALAVALISQYGFDMQPCAWCVFQRLLYLAIGVLALIGLLGSLTGGRFLARLAALLGVLLSAGGIAAAWYQYSVASHMMSCAQTFADRFMGATGLDAMVPWLFGIYATCADAMVKVLGVEYALWSLALFVLILLASLTALFKRR
ncbi:MAG TPA: disulfide bond formation protein B [Bordetella sp.]